MIASGIVNRFFYEPAHNRVLIHLEGDSTRYEFNTRSVRADVVAMTKPGDQVEIDVSEDDICDPFVKRWTNLSYAAEMRR